VDLMAVVRARREELLAAAQDLARALVARGACQVLVFGSLAVEGAWVGPNSDVDLVVVMPGVEGVPFHRRLAAVPEVVAFPYALDVLVYTPAEWERLQRERSFVRTELAGKGRRLA
jgi:predicted nucleotidyltransferase